jgi:hypothetical protein
MTIGKTFKRNQILAELLRLDHGLQTPVSRRDDPDINGDGVVAPDPLDLPVLKYPQQTDLGRGQKLADLVQEDGPAARPLEAAPLLRCRAREGSLLRVAPVVSDPAFLLRQTEAGRPERVEFVSRSGTPLRTFYTSSAGGSASVVGNIVSLTPLKRRRVMT